MRGSTVTAGLEPAYRDARGEQAVRDWCLQRLEGWPVPHRRRYLDTAAGRTHVLRAGSGSPTVVVVPGTSANATTYLPLLSTLAASWTVIVADVPGQPGLSAGGRARRDRLAWYGRWLEQVIDETVAGPCVLVGHSLGGAIALSCHSPRIVGRVLLGTAGLSRLRLTVPVLCAFLAWTRRPTPTRSEALLRRFLAPGHLPPPLLVEWYTLLGRHGRSSLAPPALPPSLLARCRQVPCLVATGEHDVFFPPSRLRPAVESGLGGALRVVPAAGHFITDEHPELVAGLVAEIVRSADPGA